jgi:hypothetical protein
VAFGHHDQQTFRRLPSFRGHFLKKEFTAITQGAWRTLNLALNTLLPALTSKLSEKLQETLRQEGGGHFHRSLPLHIVCHVLGVFEKTEIRMKYSGLCVVWYTLFISNRSVTSAD